MKIFYRVVSGLITKSDLEACKIVTASQSMALQWMSDAKHPFAVISITDPYPPYVLKVSHPLCRLHWPVPIFESLKCQPDQIADDRFREFEITYGLTRDDVRQNTFSAARATEIYA